MIHIPKRALPFRLALCMTLIAGLAACSAGVLPASGGNRAIPDNPFSPGVNSRNEAVDGVEDAHRLILSGYYLLSSE